MVNEPGTYGTSIRGHRCFVPHPLPRNLALPSELSREIESATYYLGQVEMCRIMLPNANLLTYGSLRKEAIASSTIEETIATADELILFEESRTSDREAVREVANYTTALEWGFQELDNLPIVSRLILGLHEKLMDGVRGASNAGRYKSQQNWIGLHRNAPIEEAIFVPCPPEDTERLIGDLERYINGQVRDSRLVQCALTHFQFETIHPFSDGNGRVGRLLIVLQMIQSGLLSAPLIYLSVFFERNRDQYYALLQSVRQDGDWEKWIEFFVRGVQQQCQETITLTQSILSLREELQQSIGNVGRRASIMAVLDAFFYDPALSIAEVQAHVNVAYNTARSALQELEDLGIVYEITGRQRDKVYACAPILKIIF